MMYFLNKIEVIAISAWMAASWAAQLRQAISLSKSARSAREPTAIYKFGDEAKLNATAGFQRALQEASLAGYERQICESVFRGDFV